MDRPGNHARIAIESEGTSESRPQRSGRADMGGGRWLHRLVLASVLVALAGGWPESAQGQDAGAGEASVEAAVEKAVRLYTEEKYSEAADVLEEWKTRSPDSKEVFVWLGRCRMKLRQYTEAREAYKKYCDLAPEDIEGPTGVARTYRHQGDQELAELWYERALELEPSNAELEDELAQVRRGELGPEPSPGGTPQGAAGAAPVQEEKVGFWRQGVAGVCGARNSTGGRVLAVIIFVVMALAGAAQGGVLFAGMYGEAAPGFAFFGTWLGTGFFYVLYWGWPSSGGQWFWMIAYIVVATLICTGVAAAAQD